MKYVKKMSGSLCYLSPISLEDTDLYTAWLNDLEITQYLTLNSLNINHESERKALERLSAEHNYAIIDREFDTLIGNCGLLNWDRINQTAEIGIFIGDRNHLGKGYGTEAMQLLLEYAFDFLNILSIMLRVYSHNQRAIASYRKIGFRVIGTWHQSIHQKGQKLDILFMELLADDFRSADYYTGKNRKASL